MAVNMARGGYQQPTNPAPVPLPGKMSRRTDGGPAQQVKATLPDAAYGEQATFQQDQSAPMAVTPDPSQVQPVQPADLSQVVPMGAPTMRPDEPVTAGAAAGPGPGPAALGLGAGDDPAVAHLRDSLPALELMANQPNAGFAFKQFVRRVRAIM